MKRILLGVMILCCAFCASGEAGVQAAESRLRLALLSDSAGSPRHPDSIKVELRLPPSWASVDFPSSDMRFFVYPKGLQPRLGATARYQASGVLTWRQGATVFADLRRLPQQENDGEFTLLAVMLQGGKVALSALADRPVIYRAEDVDVALVIDSSQSMARTDPKKQRVAAAQAFIDMAARDGRIGSVGLVRFNDMPMMLCPPTPLARKDVLLKSLSKINADGLTNIGLAVEAADRLFADIPQGHRRAVVLLTDGKNESVPYADEHKVFIKNRTPVYCVGLSRDADMSLLERIAEQTGGRAFRATDHRELMSIYQRIAAELGRRQLIFTRTVQEAEAVFPVPVDGAVRNISFAVDAGPEQVDLALTPPVATASAPAENGGNAVMEYGREGYRELRINSPRAGVWLVHVRRKSGKDELNLTVSGETSLFLDAFPLQKSENGTRIVATLAHNGRPLSDGRVLVLPSGELGKTFLFDDGAHEDGAAGDGVYSALLTPQSAGRARLLLLAAGNVEGGEYIRQADAGESFLSWSAQGNGGVVHAEATPLVASLSVAPLDFGEIMPGQTVEKILRLQYRGNPGRLTLNCLELVSAGGLKITRPVLELVDSAEIKNGDVELRVRFVAGKDVRGGVYRGRAQAAVGGALGAVDVRARITPIALQAAETRIDLGVVRGTEALRFSVPLRLRSMVPLSVYVRCDSKQLDVRGQKLQLQPGQLQVMPLVARPLQGLEPGEHQVNIQLTAGPAIQELQLRFTIPERGRAEHSTLLGHEVALLLPGHMQRYELVVHEMRIPYSAPIPAVSVPLPELPELVSVVEPDSARWLDAALLLLLALVLAAVLLFLRRMAKNRMTRFACLSISLHLPLVALVVCYMLLSSQVQTEEQSTQPFTAALVVASGSDGSGPGVPEKSLLSGAPVDEEDASRFRDKNMKPALEMKSPAASHDAPEKVALAKPSLVDDMPKAAEPQVRLLATRISMPTRTQPAARQSIPAAHRQAVPHVAGLSVSAEKSPAQIEKQNAIKMLVSAPVVVEGRTQFAASVEGRMNSLSSHTQHSVEISPVAEREKPELTKNTENMQRKPARKIFARSVQPGSHLDLPKTSEQQIAGSEGASNRRVEQTLTIADLNVREMAPIPADLMGERNLQSRSDQQMLAKLEAAPSRGVVSSLSAAVNRDATVGVRRINAENSLTAANQMSKDIEPAVPQMQIPEESRHSEPANTVSQGEVRGFAGRIDPKNTMPATVNERSKREPAVVHAEVDVAAIAMSAGLQSDNMPVVSANERILNNSRPVRGHHVTAAQQIPASPDLAVPAHVVAVQKPSGGRGGAPIIRERARFSSAGEAIQAMSPPVGATVRVERAEISLGEGASRSRGTTLRLSGIQRGASDNARAEVGSANAVQIELTVGVVGGRPLGLFELASERLPVQPVVAELTPESLNRCQVVVVTEMRAFSTAEIEALRGYLHDGGRIWFHGRKIPAGLEAGSRVVRFAAEHPLYTACYDLGQSLTFADGLDSGELCAVATGLSETGHLPALAANALAILLGDLDAQTSANGSVITQVGTQTALVALPEARIQPSAQDRPQWKMWQEFSGLANGKHGWSAEEWGENATLGLADDGRGGEALLARIPAGMKGKVGLSYVVPDYEGRRMDLSRQRELRFDIYCAGTSPATVSLLLTTYDSVHGWDEYQTRELSLQPGWNRDLSLPLQDFLTRATQGAYISPLYGADSCAKVTLLLRSAVGNVLVDNLRWGE